MNIIGTWFLNGVIQILMSIAFIFSCEYGKEFVVPKDVSPASKMMYDLEGKGDFCAKGFDFTSHKENVYMQQQENCGIVYDLEELDRMPAFEPECFKSDLDAMVCSIQKMHDYVRTHAEWPYDAERNMEEGVEYVQVILGRHGRVEKIIKITTINPYCTGCRSSAKEVIENMPPWVPGLKNGRPVAVRFEIPVQFSMSI